MSGFRQSDLQADAKEMDEPYVEQIAIQSPEKLQPFIGAKFVPASDETSVNHSSHTRGLHVASVSKAVGVREMFCCSIGAVGQDSL